MENMKLLPLFHQEIRLQSEPIGFKRQQTPFVTRHMSLHGEDSFIIASSLTRENAKMVIAQEVDYFKRLGQPFEWKVYSYDQPSNLIDLLKEANFEVDEVEAVMVLPLSEGHLLLQLDTSNVQQLTTSVQIQQLVALETRIWGGEQSGLGERLLRDTSTYVYGVYENEQLVSTAWLTQEGASFAGLWGGSTLEEYRGKGYYTQLLAKRAQVAYELGFRYLMVDATKMSQPILEKFGFLHIADTYACKHS